MHNLRVYLWVTYVNVCCLFFAGHALKNNGSFGAWYVRSSVFSVT